MFKKNAKYTRDSIWEIYHPGTKRKKGGIWDTGYAREGNDLIIFMNIGLPGATGHDFDNQYNQKSGIVTWFGKPNTHSSQPTFKKIISGEFTPRIFARWDKNDFTYLGVGSLIDFQDGIITKDSNGNNANTIRVRFSTKENHAITKSFLFTWNPKRWPWNGLSNDIKRIKNSGSIIEYWTIHSHKMVKIGDRAFFMKLGSEKPKGIFASGHIVSNSFLGPHWSGNGKQVYKVNVEIDILLDSSNTNILDLSILENDPLLSQYNWTPEPSGLPIDPNLISTLENLWFNLLNKKGNLSGNKPGNFCSTNVFSEGKLNKVPVSVYERNPHARSECLDHYGYSCTVCNMNFEELYGDIGREFIHVHHLNPVSEKGGEYEVNPITDLRPVCPNCHAMIHKRKPPFTIEEMRKIIQK